MFVIPDDELDKGADEQVDKDLTAGMEASHEMLAEDKISSGQSSLHRDSPIRKQWKRTYPEPQWYCAACSSP